MFFFINSLSNFASCRCFSYYEDSSVFLVHSHLTFAAIFPLFSWQRLQRSEAGFIITIYGVKEFQRSTNLVYLAALKFLSSEAFLYRLHKDTLLSDEGSSCTLKSLHFGYLPGRETACSAAKFLINVTVRSKTS